MLTREQKNQNSLNFFLNTYFNLILIFLMIVLLAGVYIVLIKPKYQATMDAILINTEQQRILLTEQQKKLNNLKAVSEIYNKIPTTDLTKFDEVLPEAYVKERLFGELEEIISRNGFKVNSIGLDSGDQVKKDEGDVSGGRGKIEIDLSLAAVDYAGLKNILRLLESNLRLFDIRTISFSPSGNSVDLSLTTYYYKK